MALVAEIQDCDRMTGGLGKVSHGSESKKFRRVACHPVTPVIGIKERSYGHQ